MSYRNPRPSNQGYPKRMTPPGTKPQPMYRATKQKRAWYTDQLLAAAAAKRQRRAERLAV